MNSIGRNGSNNNVEKTFSGENLYHKKKINDSVDNNKNTGIPTGYKLKNSNTNVTNKENEKIPSPKHKEKLIRISEYRIEQAVDNNKNENKNSINNNIDLINRLKNQSCSLKSSITNKNQNNLSKNKAINHIFANKEILSINKHLTKEQLLRGMNILSKHDTFEICQKKFMIADKNKFNKNACIFKEKHNNSNNMGKNKNKNQNDILFKIKNLKTFHPNKNNNNNKSIKQTKDNIENKEPKNKDIENKENFVNNEIISNDKNKKDEKNLVEENNKENIKIEENNEVNENNKENNEQEKENDKEAIDKEKLETTVIHIEKKEDKENKNTSEKQIKEEKEIKKNNNEINKEKIQDKITSKNDKTELDTSKEKVIYFDITHISDVQIPKDYINTIYYNLLNEENKELEAKPVHTYMKKQKEINDQMRSILVDWIIDVHHKFGFTDETLFMTILIIDRYCSLEQISRIKYQCLGITALMIACKHEEINVPKVEDFIYITDNAYTKEEVFKMENDVLSKLNFELLYPSPIKFYEYLSLHFGFSKKYHMLGKYLMETFLLDLKYIKYKPSIISCACTYIVMKFFKMENYRQSYEKKFYLLDENVNTIPIGHGVKDCAQDICIYVDNINNTNLLSCQKKYTKSEFERVATLISNNKT
jgi:cyclin B